MDPTLLKALQRPALYDHPVTAFEVIETHISWVLLTGIYAYKFRKPVNFGFLDFTTLAQRQRDCEEELRLNRRLAPALYLGLTRITQSADGPCLEGSGELLECAVKMHQFEQSNLLDQQESAGQLRQEWIDQLAVMLADFHHQAPGVDTGLPWGRWEALSGAVSDNFIQIQQHRGKLKLPPTLATIRDWSLRQLDQLRPLLEARRNRGLVRECHGDLHLGNIVLWQGRPLPFDCIEFNPRYRWIDCLNDLAFLLMDLELRGRDAFARRLLNHYLELSGDYEGVPLLPLFKSYRAMVRAKVALLGDAPDRARVASHYIDLADRYRAPSSARLLLMHGVSGSGKSHQAMQLAEAQGLIRLRSDRERLRLYGDRDDRYQPAANRATYQRLLQLTEGLLDAGIGVVVDAAFLRQDQRGPFIAAARQRGVPAQILVCEAPVEELVRRIRLRQQLNQDPSEANEAVMREQLAQCEPLTPEELTLRLQLL